MKILKVKSPTSNVTCISAILMTREWESLCYSAVQYRLNWVTVYHFFPPSLCLSTFFTSTLPSAHSAVTADVSCRSSPPLSVENKKNKKKPTPEAAASKPQTVHYPSFSEGGSAGGWETLVFTGEGSKREREREGEEEEAEHWAALHYCCNVLQVWKEKRKYRKTKTISELHSAGSTSSLAENRENREEKRQESAEVNVTFGQSRKS